jgi:hypothetical protein
VASLLNQRFIDCIRRAVVVKMTELAEQLDFKRLRFLLLIGLDIRMLAHLLNDPVPIFRAEGHKVLKERCGLVNPHLGERIGRVRQPGIAIDRVGSGDFDNLRPAKPTLCIAQDVGCIRDEGRWHVVGVVHWVPE